VIAVQLISTKSSANPCFGVLWLALGDSCIEADYDAFLENPFDSVASLTAWQSICDNAQPSLTQRTPLP